MELQAYAKINWDLRILGKRPDGFHQIDTVMVRVSLADTLRFRASERLEFTCSDPTLPTDDSNLVVKAAKLLAQTAGIEPRVRIDLHKCIPAGGGMGGGSSDAATTLMGLNKFWGLNWNVERLQPLAAQLGSDIAFFLYPGWCRCFGRGEIVEPLPGSASFSSIRLLLILPPLHVATPAVYRALGAGAWDGKSGTRSLTEVANEINLFLTRMQETDQIAMHLRNDLSDAAVKVEPRLKEIQAVLQRHHPGRWLMSGSGAVHFVVLAGKEDGSALGTILDRETGPGIRVLTATTITP